MKDCYGELSIKAEGLESLKGEQAVRTTREKAKQGLRTELLSQIYKLSCKLNQIYITCCTL